MENRNDAPMQRYAMACFVLLGTIVVMGLPLLNGGPFFYFDTATYIKQMAKVINAQFRNGIRQLWTLDLDDLAAATGSRTFSGKRSIPPYFEIDSLKVT